MLQTRKMVSCDTTWVELLFLYVHLFVLPSCQRLSLSLASHFFSISTHHLLLACSTDYGGGNNALNIEYPTLNTFHTFHE